MPRTRLKHELEARQTRPLTLVCAPGGFGKTRLLEQWHAQLSGMRGVHLAWLSLDVSDNHPGLAMSSLAAAIRTAIPCAADMDELTVTGTPGAPHRTATSLLNALARAAERVVLFVDGYDVVTDSEAQKLWQYFVFHLPENVHCIVASRTMPSWPVRRLSLTDAARIISSEELRFTLSETGDFLRQACRLTLAQTQVFRLNKHARGWAAAVKLAAIAMDGARDHREVDSILSGNNPLLAEYMEENIFAGLPAATRALVVDTAQLERLHEGLCDYICGTDDAAEHLRHLEQSNLIHSVSHNREWYEYLPVFRDYLRKKIARQKTDVIEALHRRAIEWFTAGNMSRDALRHALALRDHELAIAIVEKDGREMVIAGSISILLEFYEHLPERFVHAKPHVLYPYVWALVITQRYREAEEQLDRMRTLLEKLPSDGSSEAARGPTEEQLKVIEYRIRQARDPDRTDLPFWQQHKKTVASSDCRSLEQAELSLGWAYLRKERFGEALAAFMEARRYAESGDVPVPVTVITATTHMAHIRTVQGRLQEALELCNQAIEYAQHTRVQCIPVAGVPFLQRSELNYELNLLDRAEADLLEATSHFEQYSHNLYNVQARLQMAKLAFQHAGADAALEVLEQVDASLSEHNLEYLLEQIRAEQAKYCVYKGDLPTAEAVLRQLKIPVDSRGPSPGFNCRQRKQRSYLALCRYLVACNRPEAASAWLMKLIHQARASGKTLFCVELSALLVLAHAREGNGSRTLRSVREMLLFGESCGAVRRIADEGTTIASWIRKYKEGRQDMPGSDDRGPSQDYIDRLLRIQGGASARQMLCGRTAGELASNRYAQTALTGREREVLTLIGEGLTNRSISEQLILSEGTVKWHIKNIFGKLTVNSRTQALVRARASGLIL